MLFSGQLVKRDFQASYTNTYKAVMYNNNNNNNNNNNDNNIIIIIGSHE